MADIRALVRQFHLNFSAGELEKNGELVSHDVVVQIGGETIEGRDAFLAWIKAGKAAFPDMVIEDSLIVVEGNTAAIKYVASGTHQGPIETPTGVLAPTGKHVTMNGAEFFVFEGGKVARLYNVEDVLSLLGQLTSE